MPQNVASHQDLHCLSLIQQFLDTTSSSKLLKFFNKYGKKLKCPNTTSKYDAKYQEKSRWDTLKEDSDLLLTTKAKDSYNMYS